MSYVSRLLFEDTLLLVVAELIALAFVLAIHRRRMNAGSRRLVWVTLVVCGLLLLIQELTVTRREAIMVMVASMARAVDEGYVESLATHVDTDFRHRGWDKPAFIEQVRDRLRHMQIDEASVGGFDIVIKDDGAKVAFRARCDWRGGGEVRSGAVSDWELDCVRREDGWKMRGILSAKMGPLDLNDAWRF